MRGAGSCVLAGRQTESGLKPISSQSKSALINRLHRRWFGLRPACFRFESPTSEGFRSTNQRRSAVKKNKPS
ncbi:hypothetical protein ABVT39_007210 [Epinephelus coioides]